MVCFTNDLGSLATTCTFLYDINPLSTQKANYAESKKLTWKPKKLPSQSSISDSRVHVRRSVGTGRFRTFCKAASAAFTYKSIELFRSWLATRWAKIPQKHFSHASICFNEGRFITFLTYAAFRTTLSITNSLLKIPKVNWYNILKLIFHKKLQPSAGQMRFQIRLVCNLLIGKYI